MSIDIRDLPPEYQAQVLKKLKARSRPPPEPTALKENKPSKYHNEPDQRGKIRFQSKKEARRYDELMLQLAAGKIRNLRLQVDFTLQEAYTKSDGLRIRAIRYKADFTYEKSFTDEEWYTEWEYIVEDTKSPPTRKKPEYVMKRKMMQDRLGITIQEV